MDIPAHVWEAFEAFAERHLGDFYCELKLGLPDELTPEDDRCSMYSCIINHDRPLPIVNSHWRGGHTYYDWKTRQHGRVYPPYPDE